jgi:DNA-binding winged helix-turn-helix (wHTH) protein
MIDLEQGFALEALQVEPLSGRVTGPGGLEKFDPKVMDVLVLMAEYAGRVVLRDDLLNRLWPNAVVTDDAVTRCFYELRRQFSRAGGEERYRNLIETLPKRGVPAQC